MRGLLFCHSRQGVPFHLDLADFVEHHEVRGYHGVLVVQEAAHVSIERQLGSLVSGQLFSEISREIHDTVDFPFPHEPFRLIHIHASGRDFDLPCGIDFPNEPAAVSAVGVIHHRHRGVGKDSVKVHYII